MRKIVFLFTIFVLLAGCTPTVAKTQPPRNPNKIASLEDQLQNLTDQIIGKMDQSGRQKIAIIEFSNLDGQVTEFGKFLAEELITRLFMTNRFEVVERQMLNKVLAEQNLGTSGLIDDESAVSLGKILGVQAIVSGSITDMGSFLKINSRLISTENGSLFSVASVKIFKDSSVKKLMGNEKPRGITTNLENDIAQLEFTEKLVKEDFCFNIVGCEMTNRTVIISIDITNQDDEDRELAIRYGRPGTHIFDNMGNEYFVSKIKLANSERDFAGAGSYTNIRKTLVSDIPIRAEFHFESVKPNAESIAMFEISGQQIDSIKFRNLKILK